MHAYMGSFKQESLWRNLLGYVDLNDSINCNIFFSFNKFIEYNTVHVYDCIHVCCDAFEHVNCLKSLRVFLFVFSRVEKIL